MESWFAGWVTLDDGKQGGVSAMPGAKGGGTDRNDVCSRLVPPCRAPHRSASLRPSAPLFGLLCLRNVLMRVSVLFLFYIWWNLFRKLKNDF